MPVAEKKNEYFAKLAGLLEEYSKIAIVDADNVTSQQFHTVRKALKGKGVVLMGKNTMMRKAIRGLMANDPSLELLLPHIRFNIGFIFTNGDLADIKTVLETTRVEAPARAGAIAPLDVVVPPMLTGLEPGQTGFFQALNVPTKINKGQIEIISELKLFGAGDRVGPSQAALLLKLNIRPFTYGLEVKQVYDNGSCYDAKVLDLTDDDLLQTFHAGVSNIACVSLATGYPSLAAMPHFLLNGYKNCVSIALETDYVFKQCEELKAVLSDPEALAKLQAAAAAPAAGGGGGGGGAAAAAEEEEEEEEEEDMGFSLFD